MVNKEDINLFSGKCEQIFAQIKRDIVGQEDVVENTVIAMIAGGNVLLEGVPGIGKTRLVRSLGRVFSLPFSRIQFTPDLMPADVTGTNVMEKDAQGNAVYRFQPGPIFSNIVLADEINRATPRTQSALLECMEERQVTEGGMTYPLAAPFLVIATQNPVETQGTFPLPEAQLDRFMIRLALGYPEGDEALAMLKRFICDQPLEMVSPVAKGQDVTDAAALIRTCAVSEDVMRYMIALCEAARDPDKVRLGPSPRALLALMRCAQALAAIRGRDYVIPDDVKALAAPVLAHRVILRGMHHQLTGEAFIRSVLDQIPVPTEERA